MFISFQTVNLVTGQVKKLILLFNNRFLFLNLNRIFVISDVQSDVLLSRSLDILDCINTVNEFYNTLQKVRKGNFDLHGQKLQAMLNMKI